jgi:hypothetical protein
MHDIRPWRPRFSLLTALLVTTIVALAALVVSQWRAVGPLRAEVRLMRDEVGELSIEDPTKIHAIEMATDDRQVWRWWVWVPEGEAVAAKFKWGVVSRTGFPEDAAGMDLKPGESVITLRADRGQGNGQWECTLQSEGGVGKTMEIPDGAAWFDWSGSDCVEGMGVGRSTSVERGDEAEFLLERYRVIHYEELVNGQLPEGPVPGFIVWLERQ